MPQQHSCHKRRAIGSLAIFVSCCATKTASSTAEFGGIGESLFMFPSTASTTTASTEDPYRTESVSTRTTSNTSVKQPPSSRKASVEDDDDIADELSSYKSREDWWKDPLAFFEDEEKEQENLVPIVDDEDDDDEYETYVLPSPSSEVERTRIEAPKRYAEELTPEESFPGGDFYDALEELRVPSGESEILSSRVIQPRKAASTTRAQLPAESIPATPIDSESAAKSDPTPQKLEDEKALEEVARSDTGAEAPTPSDSPRSSSVTVTTAIPAVGLLARFLPIKFLRDMLVNANQSGIVPAVAAGFLVKSLVSSVWPIVAQRLLQKGKTRKGSSHPHSRGGGITRTAASRTLHPSRSKVSVQEDEASDEEVEVLEQVREPIRRSPPRSPQVYDDQDFSSDEAVEEMALTDAEEEASYCPLADERESDEDNQSDVASNPEVFGKPVHRASASSSSSSTIASAASTKVSPPSQVSYQVDNGRSTSIFADVFRRVVFGIQAPPPQHLLDQIQELTDRCLQLERLKGIVEGEYERTNLQLQQAQSELSTLKQTTRYLQAQLRDNEEMMERVVKAERRKAKTELARMKESMLKIVEREREAMREEFRKQAAELETMMLNEVVQQQQQQAQQSQQPQQSMSEQLSSEESRLEQAEEPINPETNAVYQG